MDFLNYVFLLPLDLRIRALGRPVKCERSMNTPHNRSSKMIGLIRHNGRYIHSEGDMWDVNVFGRRRGGKPPVRSHASPIKGRMRSRGSVAAELKARTCTGAHRRSRAAYLR